MLVSPFLLAAMLTGCRVVGDFLPPEATPNRERQEFASEFYGLPTDDLRIREPVKSWREFGRENVVIQRLDYSCGSAALTTILRYYFEDDVTERQVLKTIFQRLLRSEDPKAALQDRIERGFSMLDLLNAAKDMGYLAGAARLPLSELAKSKAPVIVRIEKFGYKHFVVFRGVVEDRVYLADPIRGNVRLSAREFLKQWSGEALFLGKPGFGLPTEYPLALDVKGPARPEMYFARRAMLFR
jgi:predicted double-glycine peptidase